MCESDNRREFTRVQVKLEAELQAGGKALIKGHLGDISMNGMYLECAGRLPLNSQCRVMLILDGGLDALCIQVRGVVIRVDDLGMAVHFTEILGEESLGHLRNLVLLNSQEPTSQVEQEFQAHIGIKRKEPRDTIDPFAVE